jgi:FAD/FMN-containing dehydrogenase
MPATKAVRPLTIFTPGDPGWDTARRAWNLAVDQRPAAVAVSGTPQGVADAVSFAREHGLRVAAQGTGHHAGPLGPLTDTVLIRTRAMREVSIDPIGRTARVEAGALWQEVADAAGEYGLAGLAGFAPDIGVTGHVLGGGLSWLGRTYGLAANNVEAFELVTADGRLVRADAASEPDLFWALRGGGGSFGVVTAMELRLHPVAEVYAGLLYWPAEAGQRVLQAWRELTGDDVPDQFTTTVRYRNFPSISGLPAQLRGQPATVVGVVHVGSPREADELLAPLRKLDPLLDTMHIIPAAELGYLHGESERPLPYTAEGILLVGLPADIVDEIVAVAGPDARSPLLSVELRHLGAELGYARPGNGALPALAASHLLVATGLVPIQQAANAIHARTEALKSAVWRWAARRTYLNFAGASQDPACFWRPRAYDRLRRIKATVDPGNVIRANHTIPPASCSVVGPLSADPRHVP